MLKWMNISNGFRGKYLLCLVFLLLTATIGLPVFGWLRDQSKFLAPCSMIHSMWRTLKLRSFCGLHIFHSWRNSRLGNEKVKHRKIVFPPVTSTTIWTIHELDEKSARENICNFSMKIYSINSATIILLLHIYLTFRNFGFNVFHDVLHKLIGRSPQSTPKIIPYFYYEY